MASTHTRTAEGSERYVDHAFAVERSRGFRWLVRAGFVARGVTYGIIGGIAAAIALGVEHHPGTPDQQGALPLMARAPFGVVVLAAAAAGLLGYALWKLGLGMFGSGPEGGGGPKLTDRVANLGGGIAYLGLCVLAVRVLMGSAGNESNEQRRTAAGVLGWPAGPVLVAIVGACLLGVGAYQVYTSIRGDFTRDKKLSEMGAPERRVFLWVGRVGLTARAVVFGLIGYFLLRTAIAFKPSGGIGLDGALAELHHQPFGAVLLALAAGGLIAFAVFSLFEARYQRL
jgi:Domain of Unknown Function (DUF1206)